MPNSAKVYPVSADVANLSLLPPALYLLPSASCPLPPALCLLPSIQKSLYAAQSCLPDLFATVRAIAAAASGEPDAD